MARRKVPDAFTGSGGGKFETENFLPMSSALTHPVILSPESRSSGRGARSSNPMPRASSMGSAGCMSSARGDGRPKLSRSLAGAWGARGQLSSSLGQVTPEPNGQRQNWTILV